MNRKEAIEYAKELDAKIEFDEIEVYMSDELKELDKYLYRLGLTKQKFQSIYPTIIFPISDWDTEELCHVEVEYTLWKNGERELTIVAQWENDKEVFEFKNW
ncbi:MAG: hypothetical protein ACTSPI_10160 [Candidatus Heimdallarchaeaceae archaeon]